MPTDTYKSCKDVGIIQFIPSWHPFQVLSRSNGRRMTRHLVFASDESFKKCGCINGGWEEHAVDEVHHAVGGFDICLHDLGLIDFNSGI